MQKLDAFVIAAVLASGNGGVWLCTVLVGGNAAVVSWGSEQTR